MVWLTTLAQICKLNLGESPFFAIGASRRARAW